MRVSFVANSAEQLGITVLASTLRRRGHEAGLAFAPPMLDGGSGANLPWLARRFRRDDYVLDQLARFRPDAVCFSPLTVKYRWALRMARAVKESLGAVTVFGGVHASAVPETVLEEPVVDYVCVGEGDEALPALLDALGAGRPERAVPNIYFRGRDGRIVKGPPAPFIQDLDRLPGFDEKDMWVGHVPIREHYMTMSHRGCPYRCAFCFNNFFGEIPRRAGVPPGNYVRQRSVDHFIAELHRAKRRYGIRYVHIKDDIFTLRADWLRRFAERYREEIALPFYCLSHPQHLDEERVRLLKEAGCVTVQMGVESADEEYKTRLLHRQEAGSQVDRVLRLLEDARIERKVDHIFALPGEPLEAQDQALKIYSRYKIERVGINWFVYLPGTEIVRTALRLGHVSSAEVARVERGFGNIYVTSRAFVRSEHLKRYLSYEFIFRALPLLPPWLKRGIRQHHVRWMPSSFLKAFGALLDILSALRLRNNTYLIYYLHAYRIGMRGYLRWLFSPAAAQRPVFQPVPVSKSLSRVSC